MTLCPRCLAGYPDATQRCLLDGVVLVPDAEDPLLGRTIHSYRIIEHAGSGGMARVYRARHAFLDRDYAVKFLRGQLAGDGALLERFRREALVVAKIDHPNVVALHDFGRTNEGLTFLVMEWVPGPTLLAAI